MSYAVFSFSWTGYNNLVIIVVVIVVVVGVVENYGTRYMLVLSTLHISTCLILRTTL